MARRKSASPVVSGVVGLFERTPEAWRALGGPASLYDKREAALAYRRCAKPSFSMDFCYANPLDALRDLPPTDDPTMVPEAWQLITHRWWHGVRPYFLERVAGLTDQERAKMTARPNYYTLFIFDVAAVDRELFGG